MPKLVSSILAIAFSISLASAEEFGPYRATITRVVDGDTLDAVVQVWPGITAQASLRLFGIDTPELKAKQTCERTLAQSARTALEQIASGKSVTIIVRRMDKYAGRYDASVNVDGMDLSSEMLRRKVARAYDGGARGPWCAGP